MAQLCRSKWIVREAIEGLAMPQIRGVQIIPTANTEGLKLGTTIHSLEREHTGAPAWECVESAKV